MYDSYLSIKLMPSRDVFLRQLDKGQATEYAVSKGLVMALHDTLCVRETLTTKMDM